MHGFRFLLGDQDGSVFGLNKNTLVGSQRGKGEML
jgi:hypothetical protein